MTSVVSKSVQDTHKVSCRSFNIVQRQGPFIIRTTCNLVGDIPNLGEELSRRGKLITSFFELDKGTSTLDARIETRIGRQTIKPKPRAIHDQTTDEIIKQTLGEFVIVDDPQS
eukprot:Gb_08504 [translate_table: standard]